MAQRLKCTLKYKGETRSRRDGEEEVRSVVEESMMLYEPSGGHVGEGMENEDIRNKAFSGVILHHGWGRYRGDCN